MVFTAPGMRRPYNRRVIGKTIGHFEITAALGKGGMGEVYLARDTRLNRDVAIKVLPPELAGDPERMARFEREAQVLASFNDPHIAGVYGLEHEGEHHALIMELVAGQDLAARLAQGPIPLEQSLQLALQMAEGLEAAHDRGIIHRDLKPANVMLTEDGNLKLLDFGLAKALEGDAADADSAPGLTHSPTITAAMTSTGTLLGTAAYMSPEQARGQAADRRADIWAFGIVLMEMLSGKSVYQADTLSDTLAGVLARDPEWDALPATLPAPIRALIERCLQKETRQRLQAIGEARIIIKRFLDDPDAAAGAPAAAPAPPAMARRSRLLPWAIAGLALALLGAQFLLGRTAKRPVEPLWASIMPPQDTSFQLGSASPGTVTVSPDGRSLAYAARKDDTTLLYVRALGESEARQLAGTEGAQYPFWAPDSRRLAFFSNVDGTLKKTDINGSPPVTLCDAPNGKGGSWNADDVIVFTPAHNTPLHRVAAVGGEPLPVTAIDETARENSHRLPRFLPDGEHFLYFARVDSGSEKSRIMLGDLGGAAPQLVMNSPYRADYAAGRLFYLQGETLMARAFDLQTFALSGDALPIVRNVANLSANTGEAVFSVNGSTLAFMTGGHQGKMRLEWRESAATGEPFGEPGSFSHVDLSPDGRYAAVSAQVNAGLTSDIWIYDLERGLGTRFTFDGAEDLRPTWAADGSTIYFASNRGGQTFDIYRKAVDGAREVELLLASEDDIFPNDCSPDGKHLLFSSAIAGSIGNLFALPLDGEPVPRVLEQSEYAEGAAVFSPDGRRVSYYSTESGTGQVYVKRFPEWEQRYQVSTDNGTWSEWRGDRILYQDFDGRIMAVTVQDVDGGLRIGRPGERMRARGPSPESRAFSFDPAGRRALVVPEGVAPDAQQLTLLVNWSEYLQTRR